MAIVTREGARQFEEWHTHPPDPTRALVEFLRLAMITRAQAEKSPPAAGTITMIINDAEPAVSNAETMRLLKLWRKHGRGNLNEYHFEKDMNLPHDIITPGTPGVPIGDIQPRLVGAIRDAHTSQK